MSTSTFETLSLDSIGSGRIRVKQSRTGYRFNLDSVLLAHFVRNTSGKSILEFGCGSGIVSLLLAERFPNCQKILAIDCDEKAVARAQTSLLMNPTLDPKRLEFRLHDWRKPLPAENFSILVSNPPWYAANSGRVNPNQDRARSRHELNGDLKDWAKAVSRILQTAGSLFAVYRAERMVDLFTQLRNARLEPKRIRLVHDKMDMPAKSLLVEAVKDGKSSCKIEPPLVLRNVDGSYRQEAELMLRGMNG